MSRQPSLLPEQNHLEDTRPKPSMRGRRRGFVLVMWMLLLVLSFTLISVVTVLIYQPDVIGFERGGDLTQTQIGFIQTESALVTTAQALDLTAQGNAQAAFNNDSTRAALNNEIALLNQRSTQSANDFLATETNVALSNAQQATQSALDFQGTQSSFEQQATQAQLNYQGTQAVLNQNATAIALGFATAPPDANLITGTPPPRPLFDEGFTTGLTTGLWTVSSPTDWRFDANNVLVASATRAWLLTQRTDLQSYRVDVRFDTANTQGVPTYFYVLLNIPADSQSTGLALELFYDGTNISAVGLYDVTRDQFNATEFLSRQNLTVITGVQTGVPVTDSLLVQAEVQGAQVAVFINSTAVLTQSLETVPSAGAVGVYLPTDGRVERITVTPLN